MVAVACHAIEFGQGAVKGWPLGVMFQGDGLGRYQANLGNAVTADAFQR
jgi:hypothetical protein